MTECSSINYKLNINMLPILLSTFLLIWYLQQLQVKHGQSTFHYDYDHNVIISLMIMSSTITVSITIILLLLLAHYYYSHYDYDVH